MKVWRVKYQVFIEADTAEQAAQLAQEQLLDEEQDVSVLYWEVTPATIVQLDRTGKEQLD